jgi:branched-chain amino acid transport system permease protein
MQIRRRLRDLGDRTGVRPLWLRVPQRLRGHTFVAIVIGLAIAYPLYQELLPALPVVRQFPSVGTAVVMLIFMMMAVSLNIVVGYAGLLDLGYVAFYASGAYMGAWLMSQHFEQVRFHFGSAGISKELYGIHLSAPLALLAAGIFTALMGVLIGLPTLRLRGDYLAIVTLGFGEIIPQVVRNGDDLRGFNLTAGAFGINPIDSPGFGETLNRTVGLPVNFAQSPLREELFFWSALALLLFTVFCSVRLRDSRLGRAWVAIREDETAAAAMGVPLMRTKTWSYAIGAFFGGIAGAYYASFKSGAFPADFVFQISVFILCMVILGGMGSVWGSVVGGAFLAWLNHEGLANIGFWLSEQANRPIDVPKYAFGIYGVILVSVMLLKPSGLIAERRHKAELEEGVLDSATSEPIPSEGPRVE